MMKAQHLRAFLDQAGGSICHNPVFVIGSPRSGTTALARALAHHSALWTSHESYILHELYGNGRAGEAWHKNAEREQAPSWMKTEGVSREEFLGFLGAGVNALHTSRSGGRRWIDQTPLNTLMVDDLADMFPGAQFVHILRDGRRVVQSMNHFLDKLEGRPAARKYVPRWATDFEEACRTWRRWTETAMRFCDRNPGRATTVVNEQLAEAPRAGFAELYRFLGIEWEDGPVEAFSGERVNSSFAGTPTTSPGHRALPVWDFQRRAIFVEEAGDLMRSLGLAESDEMQAWTMGEPVSQRQPSEHTPESPSTANKPTHKKGVAADNGDALIPPNLPPYAARSDFGRSGRGFLASSIRLCGLQPGERVFDVGCGIGRFAVALTRYLDGGTYDGLDIVEESITWCSEEISSRYPSFKFHLVNARNAHYNASGEENAASYRFPFPDACFDFVFSNSLLTHLMEDDARNYLGEMARVLRPGGRALITAFLLDDEARSRVDRGDSEVSLAHRVGVCRVEYKLKPERMVAYDESLIREWLSSESVNVEILHGRWSGRPGHGEFGTKDIVLLARGSPAVAKVESATWEADPT